MRQRRLVRQRWLALSALLLSVAMLAACGNQHNSAPRDWIAQTYDYRNGAYIASSSTPRQVANEIQRESSARDVRNRGQNVFLRYRDEIVRVSPVAGGDSRVEVESYRRGHQLWYSHIGSTWPSPGSSGGGHRGGGPGSGGK